MADTDYLAASDGSGDAALMHVTSPRSIAATIIQVDSVVGVPAFFIGTYGVLGSDGFITAASKRDFFGHVNAGTLVIDKFAPGNTDNGNASGDVVVIKPNTASQNLIAAGIKAGTAFPALFANFVEPGGAVWTQTSGLTGQMSAGFGWLSGVRSSLSAIASKVFTASKDTYVDINPSTNVVTYVPVNNGVAEPAVTASTIRVAKVVTSGSAITSVDATSYTQPVKAEALFHPSVDPILRASEYFFNYIASNGCVWSGDAYGSTLLGSMTAGIVYIAGKRLRVDAITAHAFTLNKDTYVDFQDNGDGTAKVVFTEATTNAASPAIPNSLTDATNIRNAIIVSGATNIASVASVNQGQELKLLPIASSIPYTVTDSLGNLICPRDPTRKLLGYRQITNSPNTTSLSFTNTGLEALTVPVTIPLGRKVKITFHAGSAYASGTNRVEAAVYEGTVAGGTKKAGAWAGGVNGTFSANGFRVEAEYTPASASLSFQAGWLVNSGGTGSIDNTTNPAFLRIEFA